VGIYVPIVDAADSDDGVGDGNDDSNGDGVGDSDYRTRSTLTSRLAMSTSASKLPKPWRHLIAKASNKLRVFAQPKT